MILSQALWLQNGAYILQCTCCCFCCLGLQTYAAFALTVQLCYDRRLLKMLFLLTNERNRHTDENRTCPFTLAGQQCPILTPPPLQPHHHPPPTTYEHSSPTFVCAIYEHSTITIVCFTYEHSSPTFVCTPSPAPPPPPPHTAALPAAHPLCNYNR